MGGIAVILAPRLSAPEREACVRRMLRATCTDQSVRESVLSVGPVTLGAITTPGPNVQQTEQVVASSYGQQFHTVLCGEVRIPPDLVEDLGSHGFNAAEGRLAATVGEAFGLWGAATLRRLQGGHSLGVWDEAREQLLLARDRLGLRNLFYTREGDLWIATSELRSLCAAGIVPLTLSSDAVEDCLVHGSPIAPRTIYSQVRALRPGECITIHAGQAETKAFWSFRDLQEAAGAVPLQPDEFLTEFRARLQGSLRRALGSGGLTGCALGNDAASCLLTGSANRVTALPLRTFSLCFADEMHLSEDLGPSIARHFGTRHETILINGEDVARDLDALLASYDQPGDEALFSFYVGRAAAAQGLSALLSPIGAEAVFGVQEWFKTPHLQTPAQPPAWSPKAWRNRLLGIRPEMTRALHELRRGGGSIHELAALQRRLVTEAQRESCLKHPRPFTPHDELSFLCREVEGNQPEIIGSAWDLRTRIIATEVPDHRRAAGTQGTSLQFPFLDLDLMAWCRTHPGAAKASLLQSGGLPSALSDLLLPQVRLKPRGDSQPPHDRWWRGPLRAFGEQTFSEESLGHSGFFNPAATRNLWIEALNGKMTDWRLLWRLATVVNFVNRRSGAN